ncbi:MAG: arginine--tRNA ligase [bacterium]|nr:arginine--tRNA ligase [bacterium]
MLKSWLRKEISGKFSNVEFDILTPPSFAKASEGKPDLGDYSTNLAFVLAKKESKSPKEVGEELVSKFSQNKEFKKYFNKIEIAGNGFINFYLRDSFLTEQLEKINRDKNYGFNETMKGKKVMVEYTDPNPFKLFHIGHLMSNTIGEAIARLYEALGVKVLRVNYQGDVGLHVAKTIWAMSSFPTQAEHKDFIPLETDDINKKIGILGDRYRFGSGAYDNNVEHKKQIEEINKKIYDRSDEEINRLYDLGKKWSLEYFEEIYKRLGTRFDHYFFESETGQGGLKIINENKKIFTESEGALIFKGENYGLHSRVFINSKGLPTYEAKELGLNKEKFDKYSPDLSIIITGNEINDYFKVLLKVMELTMPEVAAITRHVGHGMLRLPTGKMSSRTGDIITADSLIEQTKAKLPDANPEVKEKIAIGAIKYSILKQSPSHDIVFDFEKSLSVKGDSAPYLQYTYARLGNIIRKSAWLKIRIFGLSWDVPNSIGRLLIHIDTSKLTEKSGDLGLIRKILRFSEVVSESAESNMPSSLALYLYELSSMANHYYETVGKLSDYTKHPERNARLLLVGTTVAVLKRGLNLLGIEALERI